MDWDKNWSEAKSNLIKSAPGTVIQQRASFVVLARCLAIFYSFNQLHSWLITVVKAAYLCVTPPPERFLHVQNTRQMIHTANHTLLELCGPKFILTLVIARPMREAFKSYSGSRRLVYTNEILIANNSKPAADKTYGRLYHICLRGQSLETVIITINQHVLAISLIRHEKADGIYYCSEDALSNVLQISIICMHIPYQRFGQPPSCFCCGKSCQQLHVGSTSNWQQDYAKWFHRLFDCGNLIVFFKELMSKCWQICGDYSRRIGCHECLCTLCWMPFDVLY